MILRVEDLHVRFYTRDHESLRGVSFTVEEGELLGLVGESGSGKSVTARGIIGLLNASECEVKGSVEFLGKDMSSMAPDELQRLRGKDIAMVFQNPFSSADPLRRIGPQVGETLRLHGEKSRDSVKKATLEALSMVGFSNPEEVYRKYPHELSGGMLQRAMIASAVIGRPRLIILDEPTTALDKVTESNLLVLLKELNLREGISMLFISHDLDVVRKLCKRTAVMEGGRIVEEGMTEELFLSPRQDYTKRLIASIPGKLRRELHEG